MRWLVSNRTLSAFFSLLIAGIGLLFPLSSHARDVDDIAFPRLANIFLKTPISDAEADVLAQWDMVILGMQAQDTSRSQIERLRRKNPDILIIAYLASAEVPYANVDVIESENGPWHALMSGIDDAWWLREEDDEIVSFWPGNRSLNPTNNSSLAHNKRWNTYLPEFIDEELMSTDLWDGVFFDSVWDTAAWVNDGDLDLDRDGTRESGEELDEEWNEGMQTLFRETRRRIGDDAILLGNGGDTYTDYLNGRMFESFPNFWEGRWEGSVPKYFSFMDHGESPHVVMINGDTENTGDFENYHDMRFALTSTLLDDGFFSYDWGTQDHSQLWWYDEFNAAIGKPTGAPRRIDATSQAVKAGVWRRDFEKGIVLVNSTSKTQRVVLEGGFERIKGSQDPIVNSGQLTTTLTLPADDGIILLKRLSLLENAPFVNGGAVKVTNRFGTEVRKSFFSYTAAAEGGRTTSIVDLDRNGSKEVVIASGTRILIKTTAGKTLTAFYPYGKGYKGDLTFAIGDVNGDKRKEIIIGTGKGQAPLVRIFTKDGKQVYKEFSAYSSNLRHGVRIAAGDLDRDGKDEIVTGTGSGAAPHVRVFTGTTGKPLTKGFFAYDSKLRAGVNVAVGDVDGDGKQEIVTGPGKGGGPHVRIFDMNGKAKGNGFFPYDKTNRSGILVNVADTNNDRVGEIFISLER